MDNAPTNDEPALENRKDLEAIRFQEKASQANIKIARSCLLSFIAFIGGYTALDLKNVITVQNAMNIGVGVSYDLSAILKNGTMVRIAESKVLEVQNSRSYAD